MRNCRPAVQRVQGPISGFRGPTAEAAESSSETHFAPNRPCRHDVLGVHSWLELLLISSLVQNPLGLPIMKTRPLAYQG